MPKVLAHPLRSAFDGWPLPDPTEIAIVASVWTSVLAVARWARRRPALVSHRRLTGVVALSAMAFVPQFVPIAFRSGGGLALAGLTLQLLWALGASRGRQLPPVRRQRNFRWLLGAAAISIPLLAFVGVSSGYTPAYVSGIVADVGHNLAPGPFAHLRLLLIVPLVVGLVVAVREEPARDRQPTWRDFEADVLVEGVRDHDLKEVMSEPLTRHLTALEEGDRRLFAQFLAVTLARRYRAPSSTSRRGREAAHVTREDLDAALAISERAIASKAQLEEVQEPGSRLSASSCLSRPEGVSRWH